MFIYLFIYFLDIDIEMNLDVKECSLLNCKIDIFHNINSL